ncbi:Snf7-domain-containing protein [Kockovaella imperatae]|uniref:Snf7-domain-containing protein n=1 Tax=Kockovaella imperatae TaxID=4999 RepID=A0A1Y1UCU6_9TREE|nr:Snf7-domain-containing protein [Kockovaella imperatae]ORX35871.1 Snf7-domain-containing protein [Kockovaella imperatae]
MSTSLLHQTPSATASPSLPPFLSVSPPPVSIPSSPRLDALYASSSSQRESNPTGYNANISWWSQVVQETLRSGWLNRSETDPDRLVLTLDDKTAKRLAKADGTLPRGLGGLALNQSTSSPPFWHPLTHFMASTLPIHSPASLTYRFVGRPLWWILAQVNPFGSSTTTVEKEETLWKRYKGKDYVHMPLLEETAANFIAYIEDNPPISYSASLFTPSSFRDEFGEIIFPDSDTLPAGRHTLSIRDTQVLLRWLSRDCGVVVMEGETIRISSDSITEADKGTLTIVTTLKRIDEQVDKLQVEIDKCQAKAKAHVHQRNLALAQLKRKKALEEVLDKRLGVAHQLRTVLTSIDQAKDDVEIMETYETSNATLRTILSNPALDVDHVNKTTDDLAEAIASQREIDDAIRMVGGEDIDEDDLAAELEGLVEEEKSKVVEKAKAGDEATPTDPLSTQATDSADQLSTQATGSADQLSSQTPDTALAALEAHERRYHDAQQRQREERQRAEDERRTRDAQRMPAE